MADEIDERELDRIFAEDLDTIQKWETVVQGIYPKFQLELDNVWLKKGWKRKARASDKLLIKVQNTWDSLTPMTKRMVLNNAGVLK